MAGRWRELLSANSDLQELITQAYGPPPRLTRQPTAKRKSGKLPKIPAISCMADVEPVEVDFLWDPFLPLGKLTLLEGDPGAGKTFLALQLAACISIGAPLPGRDGKLIDNRSPAAVLYMSAEDGLADTLRPRLDSMGADPGKVYVLTGWQNDDGDSGMITLADVEIIEQALEKVKPILLVVDPIQAYLGSGVDMHRANEVRPVMAALANLAERYSTALLCVRHLSKAPSGRAMYRGMGSIDFSAAARSILLAGQDPENPEKRAIIHLKSSLAAAGPSIGFELTPEGFLWTGLSSLTVGALFKSDIQAEEERGSIREAKEFLLEMLAGGPMPAKDLIQDASDCGISKRTLDRAKKKLGVQSEKRGDKWYWNLATI